MLNPLEMQVIKSTTLSNQMRQLQEELFELGTAICEYQRMDNQYSTPKNKTWTEIYKNLLEEMADVEFLIDQMKERFCCGREVADIRTKKVLRTLERLEESDD